MAVTEYTWNPLTDSVIEETDGAGNVLAAYTNEPAPYGPLISERRGSESRQYHFDALGSTRALTDESETVTDTFAYDAWGNEVHHEGDNETPFRWVGNSGYLIDHHVSGVSVRHRVYNRKCARWLSTDPLDIVVQIKNTGYLSSYAYSHNSPALLIDASGLISAKFKFPSPLVYGVTSGGAASFSWNWHMYDVSLTSGKIPGGDVSIIQEVSGQMVYVAGGGVAFGDSTWKYREVFSAEAVDSQALEWGSPFRNCFDLGAAEQRGDIYINDARLTTNPKPPRSPSLLTSIEMGGTRKGRDCANYLGPLYTCNRYDIANYTPDPRTRMDNKYSMAGYTKVASIETKLQYGMSRLLPFLQPESWCVLSWKFEVMNMSGSTMRYVVQRQQPCTSHQVSLG